MFMPFLSLSLPPDSPFWTAEENDGPWEGWGERPHVFNLSQAGMNLVNYAKTGASEIVPAKVNEEDHNYNRLAYNSLFPWEDHDPDGGTAMEYSFRSLDPRDVGAKDTLFYLGLAEEKSDSGVDRSRFNTPKSVYYNGYRDGVLYRQLIMKKPPNNGSGYTIDLAEIPLPHGVLRVDRCRLAFEHELTLGHFGLPHLGGAAPRVEAGNVEGWASLRASVEGRSLALCSYSGWDSLDSKVTSGRNAETEQSTVIYAYRKRAAQNPLMELLITLLLHRTDGEPWSEEELCPVRRVEAKEYTASGSPLGAVVELKDGTTYAVDFGSIDGLREC
jgi:hypothetical protein